MKKKIIWVFGAITLLFAFKKINDVLTDVGTTLQEVKQFTLEQIAKNDFNLPHYTMQIRDACKKLPVGVREVTMMNLGKVVKDYVQSPGFQAEYLAFLENYSGPGPRRGGPAPMDDAKWDAERKKRIDQLMKSMSNPEAVKIYAQTLDTRIEAAQSMLDLLKTSPDLKLGMTKEEAENELREVTMLKELSTRDQEAFKIKFAEYMVDLQLKNMMQNEKSRAAAKQKQTDQLKDYKAIIAKELRQFLAVSANVDFNAQTMQKGNKIVFVNPDYEAKPPAWKLCFRCGREAVAGARKFAQEWLNELKQQGA